MSNKTYDTLKFISQIVAPLIVFVSAILPVWNVPYQVQITATLAALDVFIGAVVSVAHDHWKGE